MNISLALIYAAFLTPPASPETRFAQVAPVHREWAAFERSPGRERAVVLVHGLHLHPFSGHSATVAEWADWQLPDSTLVQTLQKENDLFSFCYSQEVPLGRVVRSPGLRNSVRQLRKLGYREVVLVGHSAGGLVVRQFVEDYPDVGVTRAIQVGSPNAGSGLARARFVARQAQEDFLASLTRRNRTQVLRDRADKRIPGHVDFVCLVCRLGLPIPWLNREANGDGVVATSSQWTEDLQSQGIPAYLFNGGHSSAVTSRAGAEAIARLVRERHGRWDVEALAAGRIRLLGR
ncbi:MAG: hypothetical protein IT429_08295 [Gemmataceae bacterium]|nr:hypothetical protein [Gemmataceae bacterium]